MNGLAKLQSYLCDNNIDSICIKGESNLQYFTGFTGSTALAFVTKDGAFLITDSRYAEQAEQQCIGYSVVNHHFGAWKALSELVGDLYTDKVQNCAFEGNIISYNDYVKLKETMGDAIELMPKSLEPLRSVKREDEKVFLRKAAEIADKAFADTLPLVKPGMTENQVRVILESKMLEYGSEGPSFETIIASGYRSSMPHGVASDKVIENGDFVTFDFGAIYKGYHSDMTRTIVMGKASERQKFLYESVLKAQELGVEAVKAGAICSEIDKEVRSYLENKNLNDYFTHGLGHGVGLDIHEFPILSPRCDEVLEEGMLVTVEPGVYFEGDIGLRIEDSVFVTKDGCEIITKTSKELLEIFNI